MINNKYKLTGYTLLEISIIIVVLSVIAIGITNGLDVINNYKITSVISDLTKYKSAYNDFKTKYNAIPGDMYDAVNQLGCDNCNGDGDGQITRGQSENFFAWQHLSLAELIKGSYGGSFKGDPILPGKNLPGSPYKRAGFDIYYYTNPDFADYSPNNAIIFGSAGDGTVNYSLLPPDQAKIVDDRIDDGYPYSGALNSSDGASGSNVSCVSSNAYNINISTSSKSCILVYFVDKLH